MFLNLGADPTLIDPAAMPTPHLISTPPWLAYLAVASAAVSGFHGYRRNKSIGWAALWFVAGGLLPVFVPVLAVSQGFAKPKKA